MKKFLVLMLFFLTLTAFSIETEILTMDEYLSINNKKSSKLKLNQEGIVTYNDKVVLNFRNAPLSDETALTDTEFLILFRAKKVKPRFGCNPKNTKRNGTLGCYINN